jgi:hypothetical protein
LGVDPYLDHTPFQTRVRCLTGFAQQTGTGFYGQRQQVQSSTVSQVILAIGQTIALACNHNLTKVNGSEKFLPTLQVMLDGYFKSDPPTRKMLPIKADVPNLLVEMGNGKGGTAHAKAIGDLSMIAFYYLLCIGEYTVKGKQNNKKQTVQFKLKVLGGDYEAQQSCSKKLDLSLVLRTPPRKQPGYRGNQPRKPRSQGTSLTYKIISS